MLLNHPLSLRVALLFLSVSSRCSYPDTGGGQFSQKLSVTEWMEFANAQRAHYNYVEGVASILVFLLVSGLFYPRYTAACGLAYIVGRVMFAVGYTTKGQSGGHHSNGQSATLGSVKR